MAPIRTQMSVSKERFSMYFKTLKTTAYHDPGSRGPGSHITGTYSFIYHCLPHVEFVGYSEVAKYELGKVIMPISCPFEHFADSVEIETTELMTEGRIRCLDWNPLGTLVATGSADRTLRVWNPDRPNIRNSTELKGHEASIEKVAFNPVKDAELCSVSSDGVVKFWDVRTKACINEVKGLGDAFTLAWHPDGDSVIVGNKADTIFFLDPTKSTPIATHQRDVQTNQIIFDWSGTKIFITTGEGRVQILNYPDLTSVYGIRAGEEKPFSLNGHTSSCLSVALQPTARHLATGGSDSIISLWDTKNWICQRTLVDMVGPVRSISFSFDGSYIVGGSDEGTGLEIAHVETGEYIHTVKTSAPCPVVGWHPSRYHLAYADLGGLKIIGVDPERK